MHLRLPGWHRAVVDQEVCSGLEKQDLTWVLLVEPRASEKTLYPFSCGPGWGTFVENHEEAEAYVRAHRLEHANR